MKKYQLLELIAEIFQKQDEIRSTSIDYKHSSTGDESGSMIVVAKDESVFEVRVRRI